MNKQDSNSTMNDKNEHKKPQIVDKQYFGLSDLEGFDIIPNKTNTFHLIVKTVKKTPKNPFQSCHFYIYNLKKGEVIAEKKLFDGGVEWQNDNTIVFYESNRDYRDRFKLDVVTGTEKKIKKNNLERDNNNK